MCGVKHKITTMKTALECFLNIYRSQTDFLYHFICSKGNNSEKEYNKECFIENEYVHRKLLKNGVVMTSHERL